MEIQNLLKLNSIRIMLVFYVVCNMFQAFRLQYWSFTKWVVCTSYNSTTTGKNMIKIHQQVLKHSKSMLKIPTLLKIVSRRLGGESFWTPTGKCFFFLRA